MKDLVSEELKENEGKVFTKKETKDIIKKDYNPFEVNSKIYKRRSELFMEEMIKGEIEKELNQMNL